jgi:hypothetical protein
MLCYKDRSWCSASSICGTVECGRRVTPAIQADADAWWGKEGAPFSFMDYSGRCGEFRPIEKEIAHGAA